MLIVMIFVLCSSAAGSQDNEVVLHPDLPFLNVKISENVNLSCCFTPNGKPLTYTWVFIPGNSSTTYVLANESNISPKSGRTCGSLTLESVVMSNSGFYQCQLTGIEPKLYTHGTYLQVYQPLAKTINISETTKNWILAAEGILLLLCVLLPSTTLLLKSKRVKLLEKKQAMKEEENIYQGLNLDDCCSAYDQIERFQGQGPYQDVCNITEEEKDIQLEKP